MKVRIYRCPDWHAGPLADHTIVYEGNWDGSFYPFSPQLDAETMDALTQRLSKGSPTGWIADDLVYIAWVDVIPEKQPQEARYNPDLDNVFG